MVVASARDKSGRHDIGAVEELLSMTGKALEEHVNQTESPENKRS